MSPGPTFDRVYLALKEQLTSGHFAPGDHLEPAVLGDELNASITPVRDALHRLVGERIIEAPRNDGFRAPAPLEAELRDLYGWNGLLLELAVRCARRRGLPPADATSEGAPAEAADLFRRISRLAGNAEHEAAVENLNDRLSALRAAEARIFADVEAELAGIRSMLEAQDLAGVRRAIAAYHRRRQRSVPEILVAARRLREPL